MTRIRTGDWINEAWRIVQADLGMFIVAMLIMGIAGSIPYVGTALSCSLYYMVFKRIQGGAPLNLSDLGRGLQADMGLPAFLAGLIQGAIVTAAVFAAMCLGAIFFPFFLIIPIVALLCSMMWMFTLPLIADRKLDFWSAMETSRKTVMANFGGFLGFAILVGLVYLLGAVLCGVGVLVTGPIAMVAVALAYRDVFGIRGISAEGDGPAWSAAAPPPPPPPPTPPTNVDPGDQPFAPPPPQ